MTICSGQALMFYDFYESEFVPLQLSIIETPLYFIDDHRNGWERMYGEVIYKLPSDDNAKKCSLNKK